MDNETINDYKGLTRLEQRSTMVPHGQSAREVVFVESVNALIFATDRRTAEGEIVRAILTSGRVAWLVAGPCVDGGNGAVAVFRTRGAARRFLRSAA